jgi:transposase
MDTPMHGKRVLINIDRQRYRCISCRKTLSDPLSDIDGKRQATSRLIRYIEKHCLKEAFLSLAREVGVDDKTVRFIFDDMVQRLERQIQFETPTILGIDEIHILDEYRAVLTNIEKLSMFDMRPTRKKVDL